MELSSGNGNNQNKYLANFVSKVCRCLLAGLLLVNVELAVVCTTTERGKDKDVVNHTVLNIMFVHLSSSSKRRYMVTIYNIIIIPSLLIITPPQVLNLSTTCANDKLILLLHPRQDQHIRHSSFPKGLNNKRARHRQKKSDFAIKGHLPWV